MEDVEVGTLNCFENSRSLSGRTGSIPVSSANKQIKT